MSRCAACGAKFNKGRRRHVILASGDLVVRLVCPSCAGRAVMIVPVVRGPACVHCPPGDAADATTCNPCLNAITHKAIRASLAPFVDRLRSLSKAYTLDATLGLGPGLAMAADILDTARN